MSPLTLLAALALAWLTSSCVPEQQLARLLDRHPALLTQIVGPQQVSDSTVVQVRDSVVTVNANGQSYRVVIPVREVTRYRSRISTLVLDNARARRLLAEARIDAKLTHDQFQASQREVARLTAMAFPHWYSSPWFWVSVLLFVLLAVSVGLRFAKFSFLPL